ncbi:MAG: V-type ATP synthase subunit F [Cloacibacillus evryensis]
MKAYLVSDNHDSLVGMRLAGIEGTLVHTPDETYAAIEAALKMRNLAILAITEKAAEMAEEIIQQLRERGDLPLVVEIPDRFGTKRGPDFLTRYVQEAIGVRCDGTADGAIPGCRLSPLPPEAAMLRAELGLN